MKDYFERLKNTLKSGQKRSKMVEIWELCAAERRQRAPEDFDMAFSRRCRLLQPCVLQLSCVS